MIARVSRVVTHVAVTTTGIGGIRTAIAWDIAVRVIGISRIRRGYVISRDSIIGYIVTGNIGRSCIFTRRIAGKI